MTFFRVVFKIPKNNYRIIEDTNRQTLPGEWIIIHCGFLKNRPVFFKLHDFLKYFVKSRYGAINFYNENLMIKLDLWSFFMSETRGKIRKSTFTSKTCRENKRFIARVFFYVVQKNILRNVLIDPISCSKGIKNYIVSRLQNKILIIYVLRFYQARRVGMGQKDHIDSIIVKPIFEEMCLSQDFQNS